MDFSNKGIEISSSTKITSIEEFKQAGYGFISIRCLTPKGEADTEFANNVTLCIEHDIPFKIFCTTTTMDALPQLMCAMKVAIAKTGIDKTKFKEIIVKIGANTIKGLDNLTGLFDLIDAHLSEYGIPYIYGSNYTTYNKLPDDIKSKPMFISRYPFGTEDDGTVHVELKPDCEKLLYWNYTAKGSIPGIEGNVPMIKTYVYTKSNSVLSDNMIGKYVEFKKPTKIRNKPSMLFSKTVDIEYARVTCIEYTTNSKWIKVRSSNGVVGYVLKTDFINNTK